MNNWKRSGRLGLVFGLSLGMTMSLVPMRAADDSRSQTGKLEGTWFTQVTIRDCQNGAVLRTFSALNTFNSGGTMTDTTTGASPSLRSPGLGKWEKAGSKTYNAISLAFLFNSAGIWTGTQKLAHTIEVVGNNSTFTSTNQIFDPSGTLVSTGCATAVGQQM